MKLVNTKLALDMLEVGKKEFLEKGFQKASMRDIAASLKVTTGAIYRYYKDKEALFDAIVKEPADILVERYLKEQEDFTNLSTENQLKTLHKITSDSYDWIMDYIYDNYDAFKLIICCSNNTKYEDYIERLIDIEVKASQLLLQRMQKEHLIDYTIDDNLIHIVVTAFFNGIFETVAHDIKKNDAIKYMTQLKDFYSAGWFKLLGIA